MAPAKKDLDGTKDGLAEVTISTNGVTFSTNSLVFNYFQDATFNDISSPYLLFDLESENIMTGTFPQIVHQTTPVIVLETIDKVRSHKAVVISNSPTEIKFKINANIFKFGDTIQIEISFNDGLSYQLSPFILKSVLSAKLDSIMPTVLHIDSTETLINIVGSIFYLTQLYCIIDGNEKAAATRITSNLILCHLSESSIEKTSTDRKSVV